MKNNYLHTFGGIIGETNNCKESFICQQKVLVNQPKFKLFLSSEIPEHYYNLDSESFLWTGGSKIICNNEKFEYQTEDSKFVYVTFRNNDYSIISDHYSKIPLLYIMLDETLYFSTSLKYLLDLSGKSSLNINYSGLTLFYHYGVNCFDQGLIQHLKMLPGGSHLCYRNGDISKSKYFDVTKLNTNWKNTNSAEENRMLIDDILSKSTARTVKNYDYIGIALSGGVDSGYLAQKINESNRELNAYTIGYEDGYNEFDRIDYLANILKFKTEKIILNEKDIIDNYLKVCNYSSFPLAFNNSILNFLYKRASSDGVEVLFDGDGADRLFLGMNKFLQLQKVLKLYDKTKTLKLDRLILAVLNMVNHPSGNKMQFYFQKFNHGIPFYGERILSDKIVFDSDFESALNDLILPSELKTLDKKVDKWLFFSLFSIYYTPTFFFHSPYELQLKHGLVSNPEFWSDEMVKLALSLPTNQKLYKKTTKKILRDTAKIKIDNGYWSLSKIGLQNSYAYIKTKDYGKEFINAYVEKVKQTDEYYYLVENTPGGDIDPERLIRYYIWKENMFQS